AEFRRRDHFHRFGNLLRADDRCNPIPYFFKICHIKTLWNIGTRMTQILADLHGFLFLINKNPCKFAKICVIRVPIVKHFYFLNCAANSAANFFTLSKSAFSNLPLRKFSNTSLCLLSNCK
ncbi:MAG: hypothetical protein RLZZ628_1886, partial [Bacteroidota bacterium]